MKKFGLAMIALSITALSNGVAASPEFNTPILELWANSEVYSNVAWIRGETTFTSSCGATSAYMLIDLSEPGMKEAYALALSANLAGRKVRFKGYGVCIGQHEKIKYIILAE